MNSELHVSENHEVAGPDSRDRLSELSDCLILVILSFLPMRDVIATMLLSKRWKHLWTIVPCLDFEHPSTYTDLISYPKFVIEALTRWQGSKLQKFRLNFKQNPYVSSEFLDFCLLFAIEKQVEELYVHLENFCYFAPSPLYTCSTIKKLELNRCKLKDDENVNWSQLVSLAFSNAETLGENGLNKLLSGAPQLEVLNLRVAQNYDSLNIRSGSLKVVVIHRCLDIELYIHPVTYYPMLSIWAPNLETLEISGVPYTRCLLNVPCLTRAVLGFYYPNFPAEEEFLRHVLRSIRHVEKITLSDWCIEFLCEMKKKDMLAPLSNVKFLKLYASAAEMILDVVEMFPELTVLVIERRDLLESRHAMVMTDELFDCLSAALMSDSHVVSMFEPRTDFPHPSSFLMHLKKVEITWLHCDTSIYIVIEMLLKSAHMLEKLVVWPVSFNHSTAPFEAEEKVLSMPRSSPTAEVVIIKDFD